jgi:hypothetical protein
MVEEIMKIFFALMICFFLTSSAGSQKAKEFLYGSTKKLQDSSLCKKYSCKNVEYLEYKKSMLSTETYTFEYVSYGDAARSEAMKQVDTWSLGLRRNSKKQIDYVSVEVGSKPIYTGYFEWEQEFIVDVLNTFLGLNYKFVPPGSDDNWRDPINKKCLEKATPAKKYAVLERGSKIFDGDKKPTNFLAYCAIKPSRDFPNDYPKTIEPLFIIYKEIYIPR